MKTEKININKTPQQPQGIEIEVVVPESKIEEKLLSFLLVSFLRDLKQNNRVPYDLPQRFNVDYRGQGTFLASGFPEQAAYYEPPKPIAILGIRHAAGRFDLVHAGFPLRTASGPGVVPPQTAVAPAQPEQPAEALEAAAAPVSADVPPAENSQEQVPPSQEQDPEPNP